MFSQSNLLNQYRLSLRKYRKFRQRLDRRLRNNTFYELSFRNRNRILKTLDRLRRQLVALEARLKMAGMGLGMSLAIGLADPALAQQPYAIGSEFPVNAYTTDRQRDPSIAMDADGDYVIVWESRYQDGDHYGIFAQRYDALGIAQGGEFPVNTYTTNRQRRPSVAMDAEGDFVIAWDSQGPDGSGYGIIAKRYNAAGVAQGVEFPVNTYTTGDQIAPAIAMNSDGDFVIAWGSNGQDGSGLGVYAQRYDAVGAAQGGEFPVNTHTTNTQADPSAAIDSDEDFVIAWRTFGQDGSNYGVYAQRYWG